MSTTLFRDEHGILEAMEANGSYVKGQHIVYKAGTHGEKYLDKDAHLQTEGTAETVSALLAEKIPESSVIIGPETRSTVNLGQRVAQLVNGIYVPTHKVGDVHQFSDAERELLQGARGRRILIDDILNNGTTLDQIRAALKSLGYTLDEFRVMVDRNPTYSSTSDVPLVALATTQIEQWDERKVPMDLLKKPITTKLGKARNWVERPGHTLAIDFLIERLAKEDLGFRFDDGMKVIPGQQEVEWKLTKDTGGTKIGDVVQMEIDGSFVVEV